MDGMDGRGGACSVSTRVQLTPPPPPSSPALGYRASPKVSSCQAGQDLDLVAAHGEPRYDIVARGQAPLACCPLLLCRLAACRLWELGPRRSFSLQPQTKFSSSFHLGYPACTHTHTRAHIFSPSLPEHPTLPPPTTTPTCPPSTRRHPQCLYLHWCACCSWSSSSI